MSNYVVYKIFDKRDVLLYIGHTGRLEARKVQHRNDYWWAYRIHRYEVIECETRAEAMILEANLISVETPTYNKKGGGPKSEWEGGEYRSENKLPQTWNMSRRQVRAAQWAERRRESVRRFGQLY